MRSRSVPYRFAVIGFAAGFGLAALLFMLSRSLMVHREPPLLSFAECATRGYPILESFPRRCRLPGGILVIEPLAGVPSTSSSSASGSGRTIRVYFGNSVRDPEMLDCGKVFAVERHVGNRGDVARAALDELLKGPTQAELAQKFFTSIPRDATLERVSIVNGVAQAEFSEALESGVAGSCRVGAIRAQIDATLRQFSSVRDVVISIGGRTDDILQP